MKNYRRQKWSFLVCCQILSSFVCYLLYYTTSISNATTMPCITLSTNVNLDGVDSDSLTSDLIKTIAAIIGLKPENYVMVLLKGSVSITFGLNKDPAAFAEIISQGGITTEVKRKLIADVGTILESRLSVPKTRFFCKVYDTTVGRPTSKL